MEKTFRIQNLKCGGCETTIIKNMVDIQGVKSVELSVPKNEITIDVDTPLTLEKVRKKLSRLGYPVVGERNNIGKKATSYLSCVIGRIDA
ncbi:heavy-metal-associated domain-containing protein [Spongiivirga citrea]|uniref:Heavy metal transporter n=1 Tax=Spongiivirga citrea TaxID=1481457 RepID=A0A6M0CIR1_9FLAO|nr:heavy-metal-associated domain-containing protein [Spongiivirga citrea]NER16853.1 heavy metal transporter [Spongiivirga citrea]